jgi:hypothetical protein
MKTKLLSGSPVAQRESIRLLTENFKSNNSFLWRRLTASGSSPNTSFLSPRCPPTLLAPIGLCRAISSRNFCTPIRHHFSCKQESLQRKADDTSKCQRTIVSVGRPPAKRPFARCATDQRLDPTQLECATPHIAPSIALGWRQAQQRVIPNTTRNGMKRLAFCFVAPIAFPPGGILIKRSLGREADAPQQINEPRIGAQAGEPRIIFQFEQIP